MFDPSVERLGDRILGEAENVAAPDAGETASAGDDQEAKRSQGIPEDALRVSHHIVKGTDDPLELYGQVAIKLTPMLSMTRMLTPA